LSTNFDSTTADDKEVFAYISVLDYHYDLNETDQRFLTHADKFTPQRIYGDDFTNVMRWNLADPLTTTNSTWGIGETITGYGERSNLTTQPFEAMDIIMVRHPPVQTKAFSNIMKDLRWQLCVNLHTV
jgi:hypothetical protein